MASHDLPSDVLIRRSARARRLTLRIDAPRRKAVLTAPQRASNAEIAGFLKARRGWIDSHLAALPQMIALENGAMLPFRGEPHRLCHRPDAPRRPGASTGEICYGGPEHNAERRILSWLRAEAAADIAKAVACHAEGLGVTPGRIRMKEMRSRWGSCSSTGDLSFNWRLILAPPFVLDYVAAHEVAHIRAHDHSPRFWALVAMRSARMDEARNWLRREGSGLFRYAPPSPGATSS